MLVTIYTDGSCMNNSNHPHCGVGGWAAVIFINGIGVTLSGAARKTTSNRMELVAALRSLEALKSPQVIELFSDSKYVIRGAMNRERRLSYEKNKDLWKMLDNVLQRHTVTCTHVRGHSGVAGNEYVDQIAGKERKRLIRKLRLG